MSWSSTGKAGVIVAPEESTNMENLAHAVLDDVLYNIVHDLLIKVHRDEKIARANTAAIRVEKLASTSSESPEINPDVRIETDAAIYEGGKVTLRGNPLKTTKDILCPRCHNPRLLYPTDGKGARKPEPGAIYCKKHPYIDKPGYDIYGQTWVAPGPGRGKKKKDMKLGDDTPGTPISDSKERPPNVLSFPSATCSKCKRCILVTRLNNHMGSCIGNSGRNASRAAAQKISNGGSNGNSQNNDNTPPSSQKGTPVPGSRAVSPRKRDADEMEDDYEESDPANTQKKKKIKPTALPKKVILKSKAGGTPGGPKKEKVKTNSLLSGELKVSDSPKLKSAEVPPKKSTSKIPSPAKKLKLGAGKPQLAAASPVPPPKAANGNRDADEASESSGTLSSPPR
ncbi:SAGA-associated factor 11 [Coniochaeta hoffmannii]|uniref:SAGA-associated factor 11 n=1 Tax=Coniochaeta hoffmannii TaxID=91930 RepID=A0AA38VD70_9PEZI|nr:SAGA-associated factor 11 [Coniochaeta hoffmannii]